MEKLKPMLAALIFVSFLLNLAMPATAVSKATSLATAKAELLTEGDIVTVTEDNVRVQVYSPTLVRVEQKGPNGFEDRNTFHIVNRTDWDGDTVEKTENQNSVILTTSSVKIVIAKSAQTLSDVKIYDKQDNLLWEYTKLPENKVYLPDLAKDVYVWEIADTPRIVPAEWGFAPQPDSNTEHRDTNGWDLTNDAPDMYIFLPNNNHKQLRKDFVRLTGRTEMVPLAALGAWDSRYYAYNEQTALEQIDGYHSRNLPLDVLVIDTDWRRSTHGMGYDVNTDLFPNMKGFLQKAHDKNVAIVFNDHPEPTQTGGEHNNVLVADEVNYRFSNLTKILELGVDAWWYDRNWVATIKPLEGFTHEVMGMAVYADAAKAVYPDRRLLLMSNIDGNYHGFNSNPSNIAAHRYSVQWTGDTIGGQEILWMEIANAVDLGAYNALPYVSADLCSHQTMSSEITDAQYLRWMQMGALSPIFRPHVKERDTGRMPWLRGEEVTDIYRDYLNLRYRLLPVFYQLSHENYETGLPIVRSMLFDYPEYQAANTSDQYLLGEDILVAPVIDNNSQKFLPPQWLTTQDGEAGLKAGYFSNPNLSGEPVLTKNVSTIDFNWGMGSPESGIGEDNFSIRFSGKFTPDDDVRLEAFTDDGCRLYVDGELVIDSWVPQEAKPILTETVFEAGKTYDLVFEYFEIARDAVCRLGYVSSKTSSERSVWIPEGEWINTITGQTVYGPQTITVECEVAQMPIFVKKGSIIPLADEMITTKEKDWSHITLDVYPSQRYSDVTTLYEDDTESNDYKEGLYRTTQLSYRFDKAKNAAVVNIAAAQGTFNGDRAFTDRDWTIRVHQPENWGELKSAKLADGTELKFKAIEKANNAMPLAISGGATDGTVYEIELSSNVYEAQTIYLQFDGMQDPPVPEAEYDMPKTRQVQKTTAAKVEREINVNGAIPDKLNLTEEGTTDWVFTGANGKLTRKYGADPKIHVKYPTYLNLMYDYRTRFSFTDGTNKLPVIDSQRGVFNNVLNDSFEWWVVSGPQTQQLNLYIGGWNGVGKLEIYDESGGKVDSYEFESRNVSFYRNISIKFRSDSPAKLHIKYTLTHAYVHGGNITFPAATLKTIPEQPTIKKETTSSILEEDVDLTNVGNADWIAVSKEANDHLAHKANENPQLSLTNIPQNVQLMEFTNLPYSIKWSDGSSSEIKHPQGFAAKNVNDYFELTADSNKHTKSLILFVSSSNAKGIIEVFDETENGNLVSYEIDNQGGSDITRIDIDYSSDWESTLHVRYKLAEKHQDNGYISFTAAALYQTNELEVNTGAYQSGSWTNKDVEIILSSTNPPATQSYEVNVNDTGWERLDGNTLKVTKDGVYNFEFRIVNKTLGAADETKSIVVKKDSKAVELGVIVAEDTDSGRVFKPKTLPDSISEATIYYKVDGSDWKVLKDRLIETGATQGSVYRFKAVNQSGVESSVLVTTPESEITLIGDTNFDGNITVTDIIGIRRLIMGNEDYSIDKFIRADVSEDNRLTVADVIAVRSIILSQS